MAHDGDACSSDQGSIHHDLGERRSTSRPVPAHELKWYQRDDDVEAQHRRPPHHGNSHQQNCHTSHAQQWTGGDGL